MLTAALLLAALTPPPAGPDPAPAAGPDIRFPAAGPAAGPPAPAPPAAPAALSADRHFVVESAADLVVLVSPPGAAAVAREAGPLRVRGLFAGGGDVPETRTLAGKYLYFVTPAAGAAGPAEVIAFPVAGVRRPADLVRRLVAIGVAPQPPPAVKPPVDPAPRPATPAALRVLIVAETADPARLTPAQYAVVYGAQARADLNARCAVGPDGKTREWRIWDPDTVLTELPPAEAAAWSALMAKPRAGLPWVVAVDAADPAAAARYSGPLPPDAAAFAAALKAWAGGK